MPPRAAPARERRYHIPNRCAERPLPGPAAVVQGLAGTRRQWRDCQAALHVDAFRIDQGDAVQVELLRPLEPAQFFPPRLGPRGLADRQQRVRHVEQLRKVDRQHRQSAVAAFRQLTEFAGLLLLIEMDPVRTGHARSRPTSPRSSARAPCGRPTASRAAATCRPWTAAHTCAATLFAGHNPTGAGPAAPRARTAGRPRCCAGRDSPHPNVSSVRRAPAPAANRWRSPCRKRTRRYPRHRSRCGPAQNGRRRPGQASSPPPASQAGSRRMNIAPNVTA